MENKIKDIQRIYYDHLKVLGKGYETGDFSALFGCLAEECVWESMWVLHPRVGYGVVKAYYEEKGQILVANNCCPQASVVELVGNMNVGDSVTDANGTPLPRVGLLYDPGELCMYMRQETDGEINESIVKLTLNEENKIKRIDMCEPSFFSFRRFKEWEFEE